MVFWLGCAGVLISYESVLLFIKLAFNPFFTLKKMKWMEQDSIVKVAQELRLKGLQNVELKGISSKLLKHFLELNLQVRQEEEVRTFFQLRLKEEIEVYLDLIRVIHLSSVIIWIFPIILVLIKGLKMNLTDYGVVVAHSLWLQFLIFAPLKSRAQKLYLEKLKFIRCCRTVYQALIEGESVQGLKEILAQNGSLVG
jgi:hypothetical protein